MVHWWYTRLVNRHVFYGREKRKAEPDKFEVKNLNY